MSADRSLERLLRGAVLGLLVVWAVACTAWTVREWLGPAGWSAARGGRFPATVGMPLPGAADVQAVRELIAAVETRGALPWLVALPPAVRDFPLTYLRFQLTHLEYPRRVDVIRADQRAPLGNAYGGVITAPGQSLSTGTWRVAGRRAGYTAYVREGS